jgi:glycosyltransferase involved in cell wall biosynthesis
LLAQFARPEAIAARADAGRSRVRESTPARLLMVAWLTSAKDHQTAIRAVASLRQRGHDIRLDLAGGVNRQARQDALQELAHTLGVSDIVTFLGVRADIPELLGASDILIHSSHSEGFGLSVIEAFASRTPVVATDIPACREALDGGRCGILVAPRNPEAMADAVETLLTNQRMRAGYAGLIDRATASTLERS